MKYVSIDQGTGYEDHLLQGAFDLRWNNEPLFNETGQHLISLYNARLQTILNTAEDSPFFALLSLQAPHFPLEAPPGYQSNYSDVTYDPRKVRARSGL